MNLFDLLIEKLYHEGIYDVSIDSKHQYLYWNQWQVRSHEIDINKKDLAFFQTTIEGNWSYIRIYKGDYNLNYLITHEDSLDSVSCKLIKWHNESLICLYRNVCNTLVSITGTDIIKLDINPISNIVYYNKSALFYEIEPGTMNQIQLPELIKVNEIPKTEFDNTIYEIILL